MKKYTVIYGENFTRGSMHCQLVRYSVVECNPDDLTKTIEDGFGWDNVHFVFDGECKETQR